jgi:hypothetical protein
MRLPALLRSADALRTTFYLHSGNTFVFSERRTLLKEAIMTDYDDDDAFENGVLRDGARHRVPMQMRDSIAPMITDGTSDPLGLHRPGWRIPSGGSERDVAIRDSQRKLVEEAHAEYLDRLTNAWKGNWSTDTRGR